MKTLWTTVLALLLAALSYAQSPSFVGEEFRLDTTGATFVVDAEVSSDPAGNFVAAWDNLASGRVFARRYQADGAPIGNGFQVNTDASYNNTRYPRLDHGSGGQFVVVWHGGSDGSFTGIEGQRFAADGSRQGEQFQVNSYTSNRQGFPGIAVGPDGRFVVVWTSNGSYGPDTGYSIQGQLFASNGSTLGGEFQVNSYTTGYSSSASVDFAPNGEFVVVWQGSTGSYGPDTDYSIQGRRFTGNAAPIGADFQVNSYTTDTQYAPRVATGPSSEFIAVWTSKRGDGTDEFTASVQGQRFAADGTPSGDQFQVNTYTNLLQKRSTIAINSEGEFVVTWSSGHPGVVDGGPDGSFMSIQGQHFAADAERAGIEFQINTSTVENQYRSSVASLPNGHFVIAWQDSRTPRPIRGQRIDTRIFVDGFESGDVSAWSAISP